jgi:hypothetical protein
MFSSTYINLKIKIVNPEIHSGIASPFTLTTTAPNTTIASAS